MKLGTKSLLFGVHQFLWHPVTVWRAWRELYGVRPSWRECVCIFLHDWGYWGCETMDGFDGARHPRRGARIAGWLFGFDFYLLVLLHSRTYAAELGKAPSKLCWADKLSMAYEPQWFYLLRARWTGELAEYRAHAHARGQFGAELTDAQWHERLVQWLRVMARREADAFLVAEVTAHGPWTVERMNRAITLGVPDEVIARNYGATAPQIAALRRYIWEDGEVVK